MSYATELTTLESAFNTAWANTTPIQFENDGAFEAPTDQSSYVRFWVMPGASQVIAGRGANNRLYRHPGVIQIDILTPKGLGALPALTLADQAAAIFRGKRISDIICRAPMIVRPLAESGYFRVTVSVIYQRDEILQI